MKMVYVFHVDTGRMMTFDMSLAFKSVQNLKTHVQDACKIPAAKQVLLISGGESLNPKRTVCSYTAGTDSNPIFLFSKCVYESPTPPASSVDYGSDGDLKDKFRECMDLPATLTTVTRRCQLAQQYLDLANEQSRICENLVLDQHLQQQGWAAVVANLEDCVIDFKKFSENFVKNYNEYMVERDAYFTFLTHFNNDLDTLQKIPMLQILIELEKERKAAEEAALAAENALEGSKSSDNSTSLETEETKETDETPELEEKQETKDNEAECLKDVTLYQWILESDEKGTMDQLYEHCSQGLTQYDSKLFGSIKDMIDEKLKDADNPQLKEVKGLGQRLFNLDEFMREARKYVQLQDDLAKSFGQNQTRASHLQDQSILPDLCASHRKQLQLISYNHQQLCDIRRRIAKAKEELNVNLYHRLRWVMYIEDKMVEATQKIKMCLQNLQRLRSNLEVLEQIHLAPATYLCAVAEVVRRRKFSQSFLLWSSELACHLLTIHNEEVTRRKEFLVKFERHFLRNLFPGMQDEPPPFATQAPLMFDMNLPTITEDDLEKLKRDVPELAFNLNVPDMSAITNFFLIKSMKKEYEKHDETRAVEETLVQAVSEIEIASNVDHNLLRGTGSEPCFTTAHGLPHLKDLDRGCESETDTEEFEKVGQSPLELHFDKQLPSPRPGTQDASTSTEDNLQISRSEHDKLKSVLAKLQLLAKEATVQLRSELSDLKTQVLSEKATVSEQCKSLSSSWETLAIEMDNKEKELVESMKKSYDRAVDNFKKIEQDKNQQIQSLLSEKSTLELEVLKSCENLSEIQENLNKTNEESSKKIEELQRQIQEKEIEKDKNIKEVTDRLNRDHKAEIENIRSRFKLMTMERSPSDTNLEKSSDFSSLPNILLRQMTENFELDKEKAVNEAIQKETEKWEKVINEKVQKMECAFEEQKEALLQDVAKKISEEKDKQIDVLREREKNLNLECFKYKSTIQQLAECETESRNFELIERIDMLQKEKEILEEELERIKNEKVVDLTTSVSVYEGKVDATTSPMRHSRESMAKTETSIPRTGKLSIDSCKAGDQVLVLWDAPHESFKILQENKHMFFLHSDYLELLGIEVVEGKPNKMYCTGEVVDKEYCHVRKSENRYKVPKGTKFFRVKVKPIGSSMASKDISQSLYHPKSTVSEVSPMSQSQIALSTTMEFMPKEKTAPLSLPSSPVREHPDILEKDEPDTIVADVSKPDSVEKNFAEDSGIVDNVEQATAALDDTLTSDNRNESESSDRFQINVSSHTVF